MKKITFASLLLALSFVQVGCGEAETTTPAPTPPNVKGMADAAAKGADAVGDAAAKGADAVGDAAAKGADAIGDAAAKGADAVKAGGDPPKE